MKRSVLVITLVATVTSAHAGKRKVLVLPVDGNAKPATRAKLSTSIQKLARVIDGEVQPGDTTFAETAAAVGCDPATVACAENVRTMLGVDEVVYGTATEQNGQVTIVVRRKTKDKPPRELTTQIATSDGPERAEPGMLPLFTQETAGTVTGPDTVVTPPTNPDGTKPDPDGTNPDGTNPDGTKPNPDGQPLPEGPSRSRRDRNLGIAASAGGAAFLLTGLALWSSKGDLQNQIDNHPTNTVADFAALRDLEDRAGSRAMLGNVCVLAGLALGGVGGWLLYRDYKARHDVTVAPMPVEGGAGVSLTWGPR